MNMNIKYIIIILFLFLFIVSRKNYDYFGDADFLQTNEQNDISMKKNIYGDNITPCVTINENGIETMNIDDIKRSNIDNDGYCKVDINEGLNKLCMKIKNINKNFAKYSGYGNYNNWSLKHIDQNTCINPGHYSLYKTHQFNGNTQGNENDLECTAISEDIFLEKNVNSWKHGEKERKENKQIINGLESLMNQCYLKGNQSQREVLTKKVCDFIESTKYLENIFYNTPIKLKYCGSDGDKI